MKIVWDEPKRLANLEKHGLDFADLEAGFDFDAALTVPARRSRHGGPRFKAMGSLGAVNGRRHLCAARANGRLDYQPPTGQPRRKEVL